MGRMYNIGVNQMTENFECAYIEELSNSKCNLFQVDVENMDMVINKLDGVLLREETDQDIGKICGLIMKIKEKSNSLIWVLSEKTVSIQKILYLQLGADVAFTAEDKPEEINLTIKNSLARHQKSKHEKKLIDSIKEGPDIELAPDMLSLRFNGNPTEIALTRLEFKLVQILYNNYLKGVSYKEIYEYIWGTPYENNKYKVANLVFHLRNKINESGTDPMVIRTVRSKGYMLARA